MGGVDADAVDDLGADALDGGGEVLARLGGQDAGGDGDAAEVGHLVGAHDDLLAAHGAGRRAQDEVEGVLGVDGEAADLSTVHLQGPRDVAGLLAVAVQRQRDEVGGGEVDGVPLEDDRGLGGIAAAQDGRARLGGAEGGEDAVLQRGESLVGLGLGRVVAGDGDVDDGARDDVGRQQDGGELDLRRWPSALNRVTRLYTANIVRCISLGADVVAYIPGACLASAAPSRRHRLCRR